MNDMKDIIQKHINKGDNTGDFTSDISKVLMNILKEQESINSNNNQTMLDVENILLKFGGNIKKELKTLSNNIDGIKNNDEGNQKELLKILNEQKVINDKISKLSNNSNETNNEDFTSIKKSVNMISEKLKQFELNVKNPDKTQELESKLELIIKEFNEQSKLVLEDMKNFDLTKSSISGNDIEDIKQQAEDTVNLEVSKMKEESDKILAEKDTLINNMKVQFIDKIEKMEKDIIQFSKKSNGLDQEEIEDIIKENTRGINKISTSGIIIIATTLSLGLSKFIFDVNFTDLFNNLF